MSDLDATAEGTELPAWRERKNLLLAGAVGVAILVLGGYFLLFSGSSGDDDLGPVASAANRANQSSTPSATATPAETLPEEVADDEVFGDPFAPLYPAAATTQASAPETTPAVDSGVDTGVGNAGGGSNQVPANPPQTTAPQSDQNQTVSLRLVRIVDENTVVVRVNGKSAQTAKKGVEFGGYFELQSTRMDENEATFAYGSEDFTLVVGELKKF